MNDADLARLKSLQGRAQALRAAQRVAADRTFLHNCVVGLLLAVAIAVLWVVAWLTVKALVLAVVAALVFKGVLNVRLSSWAGRRIAEIDAEFGGKS